MIVILGARGMLGSTLMKFFKEKVDARSCLGYTREELDVSKTEILLERLGYLAIRDGWKHCNAWVINAIGVIPHNKPTDYDYIVINSLFPRYLQIFCDGIGATHIYISTDCVYSGHNAPKEGYSVDTIHNPTSLYGASKSAGESCNAMIIRTSIIGEEMHRKNSLLEWVRSQAGKRIRGYTNHFWNGVTCLALGELLSYFIAQEERWKGVRHVTSEPSVSKYDLITYINEVYELNCIIDPYETPETVNRILQPSFVMSSCIKDQIKDMKTFYNGERGSGVGHCGSEDF